MIKLIATDMDGTWLDDRKSYNKVLFNQMFKIMRQNNIKFVVASGNEFENLRRRFPDKADQIYYVAENGALIAEGRQVLRINAIPAVSLKEIMTIIKNYHFPFLLAGVANAYVRKKDGQRYFLENKRHFTKLEQINSFQGIEKRDKIIKASCWVPPEKQHSLVEKFTDKFPNTSFVSGGHIGIDMQGQGMNKAVGIAYLGQKLGISSEEMIAFGDSGNDVEMLKYVGRSYAPAMALKEAKKAANEIIGSNNKSAVQIKILKILDHLT